MASLKIVSAKVVNEGKIFESDIYINNGRIEEISAHINKDSDEVYDAKGKFVIPGIIDDQVHFREPGLTHKGDIASESRAAVIGGVTSFMEMPNTKPSGTTQERLEQKYQKANLVSPANYSFYMGAANDNYEEVMKTNPSNVCGVKIFMGSSTGNMLVDDHEVLEKLFANVPLLIATHCEQESYIRKNHQDIVTKYGENIDATYHPIIRDRQGCLASSSFAVDLAKKHNTRLHILHISTADELALFSNSIPLKEKRITAEACVHHLFFNDGFYPTLGNKVKCNPAIKTKEDQTAIFQALLDNKIDVIATDHAPHTIEEKAQAYLKAPSGLPLVQHSMNIMLDFYHKDKISMERIVEKMCHAVADCFKVKERGYIREGYHADLAIIDPNKILRVDKDNLHYKCGWSPLEDMSFKGQVTDTLVNGKWVVRDGALTGEIAGERMLFNPTH